MYNNKHERTRADIKGQIHHLESKLRGIQSDLNELPRFGDNDRENDDIAHEERELNERYNFMSDEIRQLESELKRL